MCIYNTYITICLTITKIFKNIYIYIVYINNKYSYKIYMIRIITTLDSTTIIKINYTDLSTTTLTAPTCCYRNFSSYSNGKCFHTTSGNTWRQAARPHYVWQHVAAGSAPTLRQAVVCCSCVKYAYLSPTSTS